MRPVDHPDFPQLAALLALAFPTIQPTEYHVAEGVGLYAIDNTNWYILDATGEALVSKPIVKCPTRYAA